MRTVIVEIASENKKCIFPGIDGTFEARIFRARGLYGTQGRIFEKGLENKSHDLASHNKNIIPYLILYIVRLFIFMFEF